MPRPDRQFDWHRVSPAADDAAVIDSRARLSVWPVAVALILLLVWLRMAWLERRDGPAYRELADQPLEHRELLPAPRGRILTRDGTVLAQDEQHLALAVSYRWLENPPQEAWLRRQARSKLTAAERRDAGRVAREIAQLRNERSRLHAELAALCEQDIDAWRASVARVQSRVEAIRRNVNAARRRAYLAASDTPPSDTQDESPSARPSGAGDWLRRFLVPPDDRRPPADIAVAEELEHHTIFEGLSLEAAAAIEARPDRYPGARVVQIPHRRYPQGTLAANLVGHLGRAKDADSNDAASSNADSNDAASVDDAGAPPQATAPVGVMGIERQLETRLRGRWGEDVEVVDRAGHVLASFRRTEPARGRDVVLSINAPLQATCEQLVARALARRSTTAAGSAAHGGGAIVVLEAHSGAILAAASGPTFSPEGFTHGDRGAVEAALADPDRPLVDRTCRMALPPGSVFKVLSAVALLESGEVRPQTAHACQGYWKQPDELRCAVYRRSGHGHGEVDLAGALACSCNVYFFEHAARAGAGPLVDWAEQFGFGQRTGVDLPNEATGRMPVIDPATADANPGRAQTAAQLLAIGQGELTATPLQVARCLAAIANGGQLVTPYIVSTLGLDASLPRDEHSSAGAHDAAGQLFDAEFPELAGRAPRKIAGLDARHLAAVREGLERVVDDPDGTGHGSLGNSQLAIAGQTGTTQAGAGMADHAWFAGYAPADAPRVVVVVALEHAGDASVAAGPVARLVFERLAELGYLRPDAN